MRSSLWSVFAVCALAGCAPSTSSDPLLSKLLEIMVSNMPPYEGGYVEDIADQVCSIVSVESLNAVVGMKIGSDEVESNVVNGASDIADGSTMWSISRSQLLSWTQTLLVIIEPDGNCLAVIQFRGIDL